MPPRELGPERGDWRQELSALDTAVYAAIAGTRTPALDRGLRALSRAADHSKLWVCGAALLAGAGGPRGRRAAVNGLASLAVTSAVANLLVKPAGGRRRPDRSRENVPAARRVKMPLSRSFPSGHAASAFAFATGVASAWPEAAIPLYTLAALVAYSRVHTGVHYPSDAIVGSVMGTAVAPLVTTALDRRRGRRSGG